MHDVNWIALTIFVVLFGLITWLGFAAANWRKGDLDLLHEWGLGGRRFGTVITWFLIGGEHSLSAPALLPSLQCLTQSSSTQFCFWSALARLS